MRTLSAAVEAALAGSNVALLLFVELDFSAGTLYLTNAAYDFTWNGHTWLGAGRVGQVEAVREGATLQADGLAMRLSGVPAAMVSTALAEHYQGRAARLYVGVLDANYAVVADPVQVWAGRMDVMTIDLGGTATITLTAESRLADWQRPRVRRYNAQDQAIDYPADLAFQYVEQLADAEIVWG